MKNLILLLTFLAVLLSCNNQNGTKETVTPAKHSVNVNVDIVTASTECKAVEDTTCRETLNDTRFAGWGKKEWADNDYIRAVRKYIDAYNSGEIKNSDLDVHKKYIQGKFAIADIQPYIAGGVLIYIIFYDNPKQTFSAHVYSDVDEKTRVVSNYECRSMTHEDLDLKITQEEIRQFLKECPEQKMW